jgi:hypothetical protein
VNTRDKQSQLALHRLQQADESLEEARFLYEGRKSARSIINRAYYSMFYSILALLIYEPFSSSKHSGVISYFNRNFIKAGIFSKRLGRGVNKAFDLRQRGDYREQVNLTTEEVEPFLDLAREFIDSIRQYLKDKNLI